MRTLRTASHFLSAFQGLVAWLVVPIVFSIHRVPPPDKHAAERDSVVVSILETRPLSVKDGVVDLLAFSLDTKTTYRTYVTK